jgi:hypothetical protein
VVKGGWSVSLSTSSKSRLCRKFGNVSKPYAPPRLLMGIALLFSLYLRLHGAHGKITGYGGTDLERSGRA